MTMRKMRRKQKRKRRKNEKMQRKNVSGLRFLAGSTMEKEDEAARANHQEEVKEENET